MAACKNSVNGLDGLVLETRDGVDLAGIGHIEQVVRHQRALLGRDLRRADIQAAIDLARIGGDDLAAKLLGESDAQRALPRGGRPRHHHQLWQSIHHGCGLCFNKRSTRRTSSAPTPMPSRTPNGVKQPAARPFVSAKPRVPPSSIASVIITQRARRMPQVAPLIRASLTRGSAPTVAASAVTSSIARRWRGGAPLPTRFCQPVSPTPSRTSAVTRPVQTRLTISRVVQAVSQLTTTTPNIAAGPRPIRTAVNQGLGGRIDEFRKGGRWAKAR